MTDLIFGVIGGLLYPLFSIIFLIIDVLQYIFMGLAGIGNLWVASSNGLGSDPITSTNNGDTFDTGLIFYLLNTPLVKNMFISILILAVFLIVIFTVMAFLKNAYSAKPKSWQEIIGNALKGIINFVFVPVCCFLGVWVGNILLNAINGATSQGGSTMMSRKLFICAAYNANDYRYNVVVQGDKGDRARHIWKVSHGGDADVSHITEDLSPAQYAEFVDQCYADNLSIYEWGTVEMGYTLHKINYLTLIAAGVFMMYVLVSLAYAMIRRMFILLMLFIISPAMCAMYPLDEGKALGQWRGDFLKQTISAYSAVAGMNLFFSILPIVDRIYLLPENGIFNLVYGLATDMVQLLMMVCGLFVVKEFISMITGYIGGEDAYSKGVSLRDQTKQGIKKHSVGAAKKTLGAFYGAKRINDKLGNPLGKTGKVLATPFTWTGEQIGKGVHKLSDKIGLTGEKREDRRDRKFYNKNKTADEKNFSELSESERLEQREFRLDGKSYNDKLKEMSKIQKFQEKHEDFEGTSLEDIKNYKKEHPGVMRSIGRGAWSGLKEAGSIYFEESEQGKQFKEAWEKAKGKELKREEKEAKIAKDGQFGEKKAVDDATKAAEKGKGAGTVLDKMGETNEKTFMSRFKNGQVLDLSEETIRRIGLTFKSSKDDIRNTDSIAQGLAKWMSRLDKADSADARKEIADQALSYISTVDAGDNKALSGLIDNLTNELSKVKVDGKSVSETMQAAVDTFKDGMDNVAKKIAQDMADNIKQYTKKLYEKDLKDKA